MESKTACWLNQRQESNNIRGEIETIYCSEWSEIVQHLLHVGATRPQQNLDKKVDLCLKANGKNQSARESHYNIFFLKKNSCSQIFYFP